MREAEMSEWAYVIGGLLGVAAALVVVELVRRLRVEVKDKARVQAAYDEAAADFTRRSLNGKPSAQAIGELRTAWNEYERKQK